jgi:3-phosphoshikimate 1-carboxyvinyltransferase
MPLLAITPGHRILTGDDRLCQRPMAPLIEALRQMGLHVECTANEGFLPVSIQGGVPTRRTVTVDPLLSSQFVSSLLLIAPRMPEGISLTMTQRPTSRPYIEMTCDTLRQAGVEVRRSSNGRTYYVQPFERRPKPATVAIERDWSSASYFYTMALLRPDLRIRLIGLQLDSCQGDSATDGFFRHLGVTSTEVRSPYRSAARSITIAGGRELPKSMQFNCLDCPDLVPTFAVAAAAAKVKTTLKGVSNIALKESDRMMAISTELRRMGGKVNTTDDEMVILPADLHPTEPVHTWGDHRIAMAFAPLKLRFPDLQIEHPEVVDKSFPEFWEQFDLVLQNKL